MGGVALMHRFLINPESIKDGLAEISGADAKHMLQVLRLKKGDCFLAFDGTGPEYEMELVNIDKNGAVGRIINSFCPDTEPDTRVILFQGVPKTDKMDWIIQKTVELGIYQIVPVVTKYSVPQWKGGDGRLERWNRISREACKQSGRVRIPEVIKPVEFGNALKLWSEMTDTAPNGSVLPVFCYEGEGKKCLKDLFNCYNINCVDYIGIFIGPEGGFSGEELQLALNFRFTPVSLGKRILRTETAAIAVLSVVMHEMGEWA